MTETRQDPFVQARIDLCNKRLRDALGNAPTGDQRFKWIWGPDLSVFVKVHPLQPVVRVPQVEGPRWALAQWLAPPPLAEWEKQIGNLIPYPAQGRYRATDTCIQEGKLPTEEVTYWAIQRIREQDDQTLSQINEDIVAAQEKPYAELESKAEALVNDRWTPTVPGTKGHISYPGKIQ